MNNICAQQADDTQNYKNIKEKPYRTDTSTWFNKLYRTYHVIPATYDFMYALLKFRNHRRCTRQIKT